MSFLPFQTSRGLLRSKVTADRVSGEKVVEVADRKSSCSSISGPLGTQGDCKALTSGPADQGYSIKEEQAWRQSENGILKPSCVAAPEEESSADQLVGKLVSQLCILPEALTDLHEKELEEPSLDISSTLDLHEREFEERSLDISSTLDLHEKEFEEPSLDISSTLDEFKGHAASLDGNNEQQEVLVPYKEEIKGIILGEAADFNTNCTVQLKSALRGGFAKAGLGNRPKLHVTWALDVYDPPCTSTSHTSIQSRRRHHHHHHLKTEQKSRHSGKRSSHADSQKKLQKKMLRKLRHTSETFVLSSTTFLPLGMKKKNGDLFEEHTTPLWDDFWSAKASPLILPQKLVGPFSERELLCLERIKNYGMKHVTHKLSL